MEIKDSGERREFESGAVRDIQEGKGRCDLLPLIEVGELLGDSVITYIGQFMRCKNTDLIHAAIHEFIKDSAPDEVRNPLYEYMLNVAKHFEDGAAKYSDRNWEKGMPCHCYVDSGVRHYLKFKAGWTDEPHDRAFVWNLLCLLWTLRNRPECNDLPVYEG